MLATAVVVLLAVQSPTTSPVALAQMVEDVGICDRTPLIRQGIIHEINDEGIAEVEIEECSEVTDDHLAAISSLSLNGLGIPKPKSGDLAGLTGLTSIELTNNRLEILPADFFADSPNLTSIEMRISKLKTLPAGIFDHLNLLNTLKLDRNNFMRLPPGLETLTNANFPNLRALTLGLDYPNQHWHFVDLPSGWIQDLPIGITDLRLKHISLTSDEAVWIATYLTDLNTLEFSHRRLTLPKLTETIEQLRINSTPGGLSLLNLSASGDHIQNCATIANSNSLGDLYASATQTEKEAFAAAFADFIVDDFTLWDPTLTPEVLDVILNAMGVGSGAKKLHFECADLEGFTGASLSKYTNLQTLKINDSNLGDADFVPILENVADTGVATLSLKSNNFRDVVLPEGQFVGRFNNLTELDFSQYHSCNGPWIDDYTNAGFTSSQIEKINPKPTDEPEICIPPTPTPVPVEEQEPGTPIDEGAMILRIEPAIQGIRVWTETDFVLSTNVYGMQDKLDNSLADRVGVDKVRFDWEDTRRSGTISEATRHALRQNSTPDDRVVRYSAPRIPGTYIVKANIPHSNGCRGPRGDETEEQAEARCTAEFEIVVRYKQETETEFTVAKNPSGPIPSYVVDERGERCPVFTPEEGGSLIEDGYSISAEPGAVENNTYIAVCMNPSGPATNAGMTHQRFTLDGDAYSVSAFDTQGRRFTNYHFLTHAEACLPIAEDLRTRISDVELIAVNLDKSLTVLSTTLTFSGDDIQACAPVSKLPTKLAIGVKGAPGPAPAQDFDTQIEEPETGGRTPDKAWVLLMLILGAAVAITSVLAIGRTRDSV